MYTMQDLINRIFTINKKSMKNKGLYPVDYMLKEKIKPKYYETISNGYAKGCKLEDIAVVFDTTIFNSGKDGFIFSYDKFYGNKCFKCDNEYLNPIVYKDIESIELDSSNNFRCILKMKNGNTYHAFNGSYNEFIVRVLSEILLIIPKEENEYLYEKIDLNKEKSNLILNDNNELFKENIKEKSIQSIEKNHKSNSIKEVYDLLDQLENESMDEYDKEENINNGIDLEFEEIKNLTIDTTSGDEYPEYEEMSKEETLETRLYDKIKEYEDILFDLIDIYNMINYEHDSYCNIKDVKQEIIENISCIENVYKKYEYIFDKGYEYYLYEFFGGEEEDNEDYLLDFCNYLKETYKSNNNSFESKVNIMFKLYICLTHLYGEGNFDILEDLIETILNLANIELMEYTKLSKLTCLGILKKVDRVLNCINNSDKIEPQYLNNILIKKRFNQYYYYINTEDFDRIDSTTSEKQLMSIFNEYQKLKDHLPAQEKCLELLIHPLLKNNKKINKELVFSNYEKCKINNELITFNNYSHLSMKNEFMNGVIEFNHENYSLAFEYFNKCFSNENLKYYAYYNCGLMYLKEYIYDYDANQKALDYFYIATNEVPEAYYQLACMYKDGIGMYKPDQKKALEYALKAYENNVFSAYTLLLILGVENSNKYREERKRYINNYLIYKDINDYDDYEIINQLDINEFEDKETVEVVNKIVNLLNIKYKRIKNANVNDLLKQISFIKNSKSKEKEDRLEFLFNNGYDEYLYLVNDEEKRTSDFNNFELRSHGWYLYKKYKSILNNDDKEQLLKDSCICHILQIDHTFDLDDLIKILIEIYHYYSIQDNHIKNELIILIHELLNKYKKNNYIVPSSLMEINHQLGNIFYEKGLESLQQEDYIDGIKSFEIAANSYDYYKAYDEIINTMKLSKNKVIHYCHLRDYKKLNNDINYPSDLYDSYLKDFVDYYNNYEFAYYDDALNDCLEYDDEEYYKYAYYNRALMNIKNLVEVVNNEQTIQDLIQASELGITEAKMQLAFLYLDGKMGLEVDYSKAFSYFMKAYEDKYMLAAYYLSKAYEDGKGVKVDEEKAKYYYDEYYKYCMNK